MFLIKLLFGCVGAAASVDENNHLFFNFAHQTVTVEGDDADISDLVV